MKAGIAFLENDIYWILDLVRISLYFLCYLSLLYFNIYLFFFFFRDFIGQENLS